MNGLLKTLVKPDWDDSPKRTEILNAANLLQVGEFQLIQLAYKVWHNEDIPENKISKIFSEYMVRGIIPIWVTLLGAKYLAEIAPATAVRTSVRKDSSFKIALGFPVF